MYASRRRVGTVVIELHLTGTTDNPARIVAGTSAAVGRSTCISEVGEHCRRLLRSLQRSADTTPPFSAHLALACYPFQRQEARLSSGGARSHPSSWDPRPG